MKKSRVVISIIFLLCFAVLIPLLINTLSLVDIDNINVKNAYKLINENPLINENSDVFYQDSVDISSISENDMLAAAFNITSKTDDELTTNDDKCFLEDEAFEANEGKCIIKIINMDELNKSYQSIFNKSIKSHHNFSVNNNVKCVYFEEKGTYTCGEVYFKTITLGWAPTTLKTIIKATEMNNTLKVYDKYLVINDNKCYPEYSFKNEITKCSNTYDKDNLSTLLKKYGKTHIHTFKKNTQGIYYWVSSKEK